MKLDKEYGNLDDLDIDTAGKSVEEVANFEKMLIIEIGELKMINIGSDNTIKNSNIGAGEV